MDLLPDYSPKKELTFSLQTRDPKEALVKVRVEAVKLDQEFEARRAKRTATRRTAVTEAEIERLAALHYHVMLEEDEESRTFGLGDEVVFRHVDEVVTAHGGTTSWTPEQLKSDCGLSEREYIKTCESVDLVLEDARQRLARGDTSLLEFEIDDLLESNGIQLSSGSKDRRKLSLAILKAHVRALEALKARNEGRAIDTPPEPAPPTKTEVASVQTDGTPLLSEAFEKWKAEHRGPAKTADEFQAQMTRFISLHEDLPIGQITKAHVRAFKDAMLQFPARPSHDLRELPVADVIKSVEGKTDVARLSPKTVNEKCLASLRAVLSYCVNEAGFIDQNPAEGVRAREDRTAQPSRISYTDADIQTILSFPIFTEKERPVGGAGEAAKWLPLLGMYTGARLEELARLTLADVGEEDGVQYVHIRGGANGRRVKTRGSVRKIPIHSKLIELGFLDYILTSRKEPSLRIFPQLKSQREKLSAAWSQWWGRYSRDHGIADSRKVFHSFRHTVKRKLRDAGVDKTLRDALMGHKADDVAEGYGLDHEGLGISLPVLAKAVEQIVFKESEKTTDTLDSVHASNFAARISLTTSHSHR